MKIEINTGNAAFHAPDGYDEGIDRYVTARELKDIFSSICDHIKAGRTEGICMDYNGNQVGTWEL